MGIIPELLCMIFGHNWNIETNKEGTKIRRCCFCDLIDKRY